MATLNYCAGRYYQSVEPVGGPVLSKRTCCKCDACSNDDEHVESIERNDGFCPDCWDEVKELSPSDPIFALYPA